MDEMWIMYAIGGLILCVAMFFCLFMARYQEKHGIDPENPGKQQQKK